MFKDKDTTTTTEQGEATTGKPAARPTRTASTVIGMPIYKLKQKLDDLDLQLRHPRLNRKWRRKIASPRAEQTPVQRGRKAKPKEPTE